MTRVRQPEAVAQRHIVTLLRHVGAEVYVLGTRRPKGDHPGTCQTPGLCDVLAFLPRDLGVLFIECKAPRGRLSDAQRAFRARAVALMDVPGSRVYYATGGLDAVIITLIHIGLLKADQVAHYHVAQAGA